MINGNQNKAHAIAVEVYGDFLQECVIEKVGVDRVGVEGEKSSSKTKIDGRPVRLVTISGKGGWSSDPMKTEQWKKFTNVSLLDHCLSVARGALIFYVTDASDNVEIGASWDEIERRAYALICIAFLHDIDKDLQLERGESISESQVKERMDLYGINSFLSDRGVLISPAAMLNYIEEVEGTQAARSRAAPDYDRHIAKMSRYVEVADKLDGMLLDRDSGVKKLIPSIENPNYWPALHDSLRQWEVVKIYDHLRTFLLDHFSLALSKSCQGISGRLPLVEIVHDGILLCIIPRAHSKDIKEEALERFVDDLPFRLKFSVNNRLACEFVEGKVTWKSCRDLMRKNTNWDSNFRNLFALPRNFASNHHEEITNFCDNAGLKSSWPGLDEGATRATVIPFPDYPDGSDDCFDMNSVHALTFLTIALNHKDKPGKKSAPNADSREQELLEIMETVGEAPPEYIQEELSGDGRARRVLLALWVIGKIWELSIEDEDSANNIFDQILGHDGLIQTWLEGNSSRQGIQDQVVDNSSDIISALKHHFEGILGGKVLHEYDLGTSLKRCFLCNVPTSSTRKVNTAMNVHGVKISAFSGRDGRNDHLASPSGDTHLCLACQAELKLRQIAQSEFRGGNDLPPLVSSPVTMGLFGGLVYKKEKSFQSMGLNDLVRLDIKKGTVYHGLDVQTQRIRIARLESVPKRDAELVVELIQILKAIRRLGRPIHLFRGAPRQHPAIFFSDALPIWLEESLGGDSLRIEQIDQAISDLKFFETILESPGLGTGWAKLIADPDNGVKLGALCVVWVEACDRSGDGNSRDRASWIRVKSHAQQRILKLIKRGTNGMKIRDNQDPIIRLAWLATRVQKRLGSRASASDQRLCWNTSLTFISGSKTITEDEVAIILGLAGTLEERLTRGDSKAAASKYRDGKSLQEACIEFAEHFVTQVWVKVFDSKEPTSRDQRKASAIYRFALLESFRERGISESSNGDDNQS